MDVLEAPEIRSFDELRMYDKFFPELFEFEVSSCSSSRKILFVMVFLLFPGIFQPLSVGLASY